MKLLEEFPVRPSTLVKIKHYTEEQRRWIRERGQAGGRVFLFIQVGKEYFLFDHKQAQVVTERTADWWRAEGNHYAYWKKKCDWDSWLMIVSNAPIAFQVDGV